MVVSIAVAVSNLGAVPSRSISSCPTLWREIVPNSNSSEKPNPLQVDGRLQMHFVPFDLEFLTAILSAR